MEYISHSIQDTQNFATTLLDQYPDTKVIALHGELGAGKTSFTKGLARALGITAQITSPTFTLINTYHSKHPSYSELIHIDTYRLTDQADVAAIGLLEYLQKPNTLIVIEWPEKISTILPTDTLHVTLESSDLDSDTRKISY